MIKRLVFSLFLVANLFTSYGQAPRIGSFTPAFGQPGTLVTVTGEQLDQVTATIGGQAAIVVSANPSTLVLMVMGSAPGKISVANAQGNASSSATFVVTATPYPAIQQGPKIAGTGNAGPAGQGNSVTISADGNTAAIGGYTDNQQYGAVWVFTRNGNSWMQQGQKLIPGDGVRTSMNQVMFGSSTALSADGNTLLVGGQQDSGLGAVWIFVRENGNWRQQGSKLIGNGSIGTALQGSDVALSADGNTAVSFGIGDDFFRGAFWVFTRNGENWTQQGPKLVISGLSDVKQNGGGEFHSCIALSADGNTVLVSGYKNRAASETAIGVIFSRTNSIWSEQSARLQVSGGAIQGRAVALSSDGNTAIIGGVRDDFQVGGAWVFTRSGNLWAQQGEKLVGPAPERYISGKSSGSMYGVSVALSADGSTALMGEYADVVNSKGGISIFKRLANVWTLQGRLTGSDAQAYALSGEAVALSLDGSTSINAGQASNNFAGNAWIFTAKPPPPPPIPITLSAENVSANGATLTGTVNDNGAQSDVAIEYSTTADFSVSTVAPLTTGRNPLPMGAGTESYASVISSLMPSTTYYFRINATSAGGLNKGSIVSFTTPARPLTAPIVATLPATRVAATTAVLNGTVDDNGDQTTVTFLFGTFPSLAGGSTLPATPTNPVSPGSGPGHFTAELFGLLPETQYYFRVIGINGGGTTRGTINSFMTSNADVSVIPNTFSPNNDGINDTWKIPGIELYPKCILRVFNRNGETVYSSLGFSGWNGESGNRPLPTGTYFYVINFKEDSTPVAGAITIVR